MVQNVCVIVNNQGLNVFDFEMLTIAFYVYEILYNYLVQLSKNTKDSKDKYQEK